MIGAAQRAQRVAASAKAKEIRDATPKSELYPCGHERSSENTLEKKPCPSYPWVRRQCRECENARIRLRQVGYRARAKMDREIVFQRAFGA